QPEMRGQVGPTDPAIGHHQHEYFRIVSRYAIRHILRYHIAMNAFETIDELASFVAAFESGQLPKARWTHGAHLAIAFWYLRRLEQPLAAKQIRAGIRHYNDAKGAPNTDHSGYHETLTEFWIRVVSKFIANAGYERSEVELVSELLD